MSILEFVLRATLTATFLLSAAGKAMALDKSARMLSGLLPVPRWRPLASRAGKALVARILSGRLLASALISAETTAAVLVATARDGLLADLASGLALGLAVLFAGGSILGMLSGRQVTCACFGSLRPAQALGWHTMVRALVIAAVVAGWRVGIAASPPSAARAADLAALSFAGAAAAASVIAWTHWRAGIPHRRFAATAIYLQQRHGDPVRAPEPS
jgi:hypothetical protein